VADLTNTEMKRFRAALENRMAQLGDGIRNRESRGCKDTININRLAAVPMRRVLYRLPNRRGSRADARAVSSNQRL